MPFFSSPPPPPPPPPAPAPFLASLLEDPQAAIASLLESVVEYVDRLRASSGFEFELEGFVNPKVNARIAKLKEEAGR